jgi:hypothetical protein
MTGGQQDMLARLKAVLPSLWFPDDTPVLDGLLTGVAWAWAWVYALLQYARAQTRIATATDVWLDMIAQDFFGPRVVRRTDQSDDSLRRRIQHELGRERGTRAAVVSVLTDLTGRVPVVFEPARATDTGGYAAGGVGWGVAGGWGNLDLPFQCLITAYRPLGSGIAAVAGWGDGGGGYGTGAIEYASLAMVQGQVTDTDINAAIADVLPVSFIGWTAISD